MKFRVGDKVRIKSFKEITKLPHHLVDRDGVARGECRDTDRFGNVITAHNSFVGSMQEFCGKEAIVEKVSDEGDYKLENTNNWSFIACWLELTQRYVDSFDTQHYVDSFDEE
jgi:hypothetical protein